LNPFRVLARLGLLSERRRLELYPPFRQMRVKVVELSSDGRRIRLRLPLTRLSRNPGGSMFGGYQAALADPVAPIACVRLFPGHSVWTRHLEVDFRHEGTTDLELRFAFPPPLETRIRRELQEQGRSTPSFDYAFYRVDGTLCTQVRCTVAIRRKGYRKPIQDRLQQEGAA